MMRSDFNALLVDSTDTSSEEEDLIGVEFADGLDSGSILTGGPVAVGIDLLAL